MKESSRQEQLWIFLGGWFILNLLQAACTSLFHDEAYYWYLAQRPSMGYSEHAPGVMILIWLGQWIPGELGVRFFPMLLNTVAVGIIAQLTQPKHYRDFFLILTGIIGLHVIAFFAAPDAPLFFMAAVFWWAYQRYLESDSWQRVVILATVIALMLYSKYHGAMIVFFTVLSNPALWRKPSFWITAGLALLLFFPHLLWLFQDGFGTFLFHLGDRNPGPWYPGRTFEFILGFVLLAGPFAAFFLIPSLAQKSERSSWEKALVWTFWGVLGFLILLSFRSHIEVNWAASAMIPMVIIGYRNLEKNPRALAWLKRLSLVSIVLVVVLRAYLVVDFFPDSFSYRNEIHGWEEWAEEVRQQADGNPVVFMNWYQYPSKYAFYSREPVYNFTNPYYHPTQISEWTEEALLQNEPVFLVSTTHFQFTDTLAGPDRLFFTKEIPAFRSFSHLQAETEDLTWSKSQENQTYKVLLTQKADTIANVVREDNVRITGILYDGSQQALTLIQEPTLSATFQPGIPVEFDLPIYNLDRLEPGTYRFAICLSVNQTIPTKNSQWLEVEVTP